MKKKQKKNLKLNLLPKKTNQNLKNKNLMTSTNPKTITRNGPY